MGSPPPPTVIAFSQTVSTAINVPVNISASTPPIRAALPLTFFIATNPVNGTLGLLNSNLVTYTPNNNYTGADAFTFYAVGGSTTSAVATVSIAVTITIKCLMYHPSGPQVTKDGTAVLLENVARAPMSSRTLGVYPPVPVLRPDGAHRQFHARRTHERAGLRLALFYLRPEPQSLHRGQDADMFSTNGWVRNTSISRKSSRASTTILGFRGRDANTFHFDPGYATNGNFLHRLSHGDDRQSDARPDKRFVARLQHERLHHDPLRSIRRSAGRAPVAVLVEWIGPPNIANTTHLKARRGKSCAVGFTSQHSSDGRSPLQSPRASR